MVDSLVETDQSKTIIVFGALIGHSLQPMMNLLKDLTPNLVAVKSRHPKAVSSQEIGMAAKSANINVLAVDKSVSSGIKRAIESNDENQKILVTGSISVVAEAREWLLGIRPELYKNIQIVEKPGI